MNALFIGGVFPEDEIDFIIRNSKKSVQFAANSFQKNIVEGLENIGINTTVVSAPFIGAYPSGYKKFFYKHKKENENILFTSFNNIVGIRNISRYCNMKKIIKNKIDLTKDYIIFVYSAHVPNIKLANYLKKINSRNKIVLILPDLPQYMFISNNKNLFYSFAKKIDTSIFYNYEKNCDGYILLTKHMNEYVNKNKKDFIVVEGIANDKLIDKNEKRTTNKKYITYTGGLNEKYGVKELVEAFMMIKNNNIELSIYGKGELEEYIKNAMKEDFRIVYYGQVSNDESREAQRKAYVLVNPRQNISDYTKYSFPSKNLEYLSSGNPVIAYHLDGIGKEYNNILFYPVNNSKIALKEEIEKILCMKNSDLDDYKKKLKVFLEKKNINNTAKRIYEYVDML